MGQPPVRDKHPVRGNPILIPGVVAMGIGMVLLLSGITYNAAVTMERPLGVCLLGIGVFLLVLGEMYCVMICFMRSEQIDKWNQGQNSRRKSQVYRLRKIPSKGTKSKRREWIKPANGGRQVYSGSGRRGFGSKWRSKEKMRSVIW